MDGVLYWLELTVGGVDGVVYCLELAVGDDGRSTSTSASAKTQAFFVSCRLLQLVVVTVC